MPQPLSMLASCGEAMHDRRAVKIGEFPLWIQPVGEREMLKKLTASAATGFLLLGAPGVAMAQEAFPPLVVFSVQTTPNVEVDIAEGDPCVEAVQALRSAGLRQQEVNVIQESFLVFVLTKAAVAVVPPSSAHRRVRHRHENSASCLSQTQKSLLSKE